MDGIDTNVLDESGLNDSSISETSKLSKNTEDNIVAMSNGLRYEWDSQHGDTSNADVIQTETIQRDFYDLDNPPPTVHPASLLGFSSGTSSSQAGDAVDVLDDVQAAGDAGANVVDYEPLTQQAQRSFLAAENYDDSMSENCASSVENVAITALTQVNASDFSQDEFADIDVECDNDADNLQTLRSQLVASQLRLAPEADESSDVIVDIDTHKAALTSLPKQEPSCHSQRHQTDVTSASEASAFSDILNDDVVMADDDGSWRESSSAAAAAVADESSSSGQHTPFRRVDSSAQLARINSSSAVSSPDAKFSECSRSVSLHAELLPSDGREDVSMTACSGDNKRKRVRNSSKSKV